MKRAEAGPNGGDLIAIKCGTAYPELLANADGAQKEMKKGNGLQSH